MTINDWFAFWRAHPAAPETGRLAFLRWRFNLSTFAFVLLMGRIIGGGGACRGIVLAAPPLLAFSLVSGVRYLRLKDVADKAYIDARIAEAARDATGTPS